MMPGMPEESKGPKEDTTFDRVKTLLYTQRTEDIVDVINRLWKEEITIEELRGFVGRHFWHPERRELFQQIIHEFMKDNAPSPLKSRAFKQTFEMDAWADYQERLLRVDALSSVAGQLGSRRPLDREKEFRPLKSLDEMFGRQDD